MTHSALNRSTWIADGLRWIGSLCESTADAIDRSAPAPREPAPYRDPEEFLDDVRFRLHTRL